MLNVMWEDKMKNEEILKRCGIEKLDNEIRRRRMRWYGHVMREDENLLRRAWRWGIKLRKLLHLEDLIRDGLIV